MEQTRREALKTSQRWVISKVEILKAGSCNSHWSKESERHQKFLVLNPTPWTWQWLKIVPLRWPCLGLLMEKLCYQNSMYSQHQYALGQLGLSTLEPSSCLPFNRHLQSLRSGTAWLWMNCFSWGWNLSKSPWARLPFAVSHGAYSSVSFPRPCGVVVEFTTSSSST